MQLYKEFSQSGLINTAKHTVHESGVLGLYRGLSVLVFFSVPKTGIRFYSKGYYEDLFPVGSGDAAKEPLLELHVWNDGRHHRGHPGRHPDGDDQDKANPR